MYLRHLVTGAPYEGEGKKRRRAWQGSELFNSGVETGREDSKDARKWEDRGMSG